MLNPPFNEDDDRDLREILKIVRRTMIRELKRGRPGPPTPSLENLVELVKQGRIVIHFRPSNPPRPELVLVPLPHE